MTEHVEETKVVQIRRMPGALHKWLRQRSLDTNKSMECLIIEAVECFKNKGVK